MKISRNWLQTYFEVPLPDAAILGDALTFHAFEIDGIEEKDGDSVLDVKVTANRGHDCLSHRGIAMELAAILKLPTKLDPLRQPLDLSPVAKDVRVSIESPLCHRYVAGHIEGVTVGPSPEWLVQRLAAMGQRSVNNVVDATNYVMFGLGQPLHAFDAGQFEKSPDGKYEIAVREATEGEQFISLEDKAYTLNQKNLVIGGFTYSPTAATVLGLAGVKGGKLSGISTATTSIIIESANFDGISVRKTAQMHKLRTDASTRFEQVLSPEYAGYGMQAAIDLILELAGGTLLGVVDAYPDKPEVRFVSVTLSQTNALLGTALRADDVVDALTRLSLPFEESGETFTVTPPLERLDILIPEDLIEEIGRIIGYDKVEAVEMAPLSRPLTANFTHQKHERIREFLVERGFSEVFTSVFVEKGERAIANKIDGVRPYLRTNLADGLADALERNIRNKDLLGIKQVKLFEIGTIWKDGKESMTYDIAMEKLKKQKGTDEYRAELEEMLAQLPEHAAAYEVRASAPNMQYKPFSRYPFMVRDIAMWTPVGTDADTVLADIRANAGPLLVRSEIFDRFEKEGQISIAVRLVFQSPEKTLTDTEVNTIMATIAEHLVSRDFVIR